MELLKNVRIPMSSGGYIVVSVIASDETSPSGTGGVTQSRAELEELWYNKFGFSFKDMTTSIVSGYNLASPADILPTYQYLSNNVSSTVYVADNTFTIDGTRWRVYYNASEHRNELQYYDTDTSTWIGYTGRIGSNNYYLPFVSATTPDHYPNIANNVAFRLVFNDISNLTYEEWVSSGRRVGIAGVSAYSDSDRCGYTWSNNQAAQIPQEMDLIKYLIGASSIDIDDPYALLNPSVTGGGWGEGNYNNTSDEMPGTDLYNTSITNGGFLTLFTPTDSEMTTLSNYLWSNSFTDTIKGIFDKIGSLGLSFQDYILSLHRLPVAVPAGPSKIVQLGWYPTNINMTSASAFGGVYDLGSLDIQRYYGNALDYKSRIQIFLPYIGFEDLDTQAVMGKTITLKYVVDYVSGDCQAQIFVDGSIHYQFKGNMSYHLPVGQDNFSDIIQQGIAVGTSMVVGGAMLNNATQAMNQMMQTPLNEDFSSNIAGPEQEFTASVTGASNAYNNAIKQFQANIGGDITRGGAVGGNSGWFACQVPFIIINRPRLSLPENFGHYHGYPSNITETLGNLQGYTQVGAIHIDDIGCSGYENKLLASTLHSGFNIRTWDIDRPAVFTLYHNDSDLNVVGKDLTSLKTINTMRLKDKTSREKPVFLLTDIDDVFNSINYLYYPDFNRFYVVDSISSVREGLWELQCSVDVLQTYAYRLRNLSAVIDRQEYKYNLYLDDGTLASYADAMVQTLNFPVSFNSLGSSNILVILGS